MAKWKISIVIANGKDAEEEWLTWSGLDSLSFVVLSLVPLCSIAVCNEEGLSGDYAFNSPLSVVELPRRLHPTCISG